MPLNTYIHIHEHKMPEMITDGKTGNETLDMAIKKLYKRFPVFELVITTNYNSHKDSFFIELTSHDYLHRILFGKIQLRHDNFSSIGRGEHCYSIIGVGERNYVEKPVVQGYTSNGEDLDEVLDDFFLGTMKLLKDLSKHYDSLVPKLEKRTGLKYKKSSRKLLEEEYE